MVRAQDRSYRLKKRVAIGGRVFGISRRLKRIRQRVGLHGWRWLLRLDDRIAVARVTGSRHTNRRNTGALDRSISSSEAQQEEAVHTRQNV